MARTALSPLTANPAHEAALAVAAALVRAGGEWRAVGAPDDLGQSAALTVSRGRLRDPGDPAAVADTLERMTVQFSKEAR